MPHTSYDQAEVDAIVAEVRGEIDGVNDRIDVLASVVAELTARVATLETPAARTTDASG